MKTQLVLIRHGETGWNRILRIQGHRDIPLSEHGLTQAQQLASRFGIDAQLKPVAIVSSDLSRARQTAAPMAEALGLPVHLDAELRERNFGAFEGLDRDEVQIRFPDQFKTWQSRDPRFAPPQGESLEVFSARVLAAIGRLLVSYPGECVVCVTHGGVLDCVYRWATGLPLDAPRDHALLNASINVVDLGPQGGVIVKWADIEHLSAEAGDDALSVDNESNVVAAATVPPLPTSPAAAG